MSIPSQYLEEFKPELTYHIYNRTNNKESLFKNDNDRFLFLDRVKIYLVDYMDIHAYCLLDNHFHIVASAKNIAFITKNLLKIRKEELKKVQSCFLADNQCSIRYNELILGQFIRLFTSYAACYNNSWNRKGNLFHRPFKRKIISNDAYFRSVILYVHQNPVKHLLTLEYQKYEWSSYTAYFKSDNKIIDRTKVISAFRGLNRFIKAHEKFTDFTDVLEFIIEENRLRPSRGVTSAR